LAYPILAGALGWRSVVVDLEAVLYFYAFISAVIAYLFILSIIIRSLKGFSAPVKTPIVLGLVLLAVYLPLMVLGQLTYFNMDHVLHPMHTGSIFLLLIHGLWISYILRHAPRATRHRQQPSHRLSKCSRGRFFPIPPALHFVQHYGITPQESQVIELLLAGKAYKEMAGELNISLSTVKNHLQNVYTKTKARSKLELLYLMARSS
jgi:DNA-binding CsgD family transcriptional regulator